MYGMLTKKIVMIAAGNEFIMALDINGEVRSWGKACAALGYLLV